MWMHRKLQDYTTTIQPQVSNYFIRQKKNVLSNDPCWLGLVLREVFNHNCPTMLSGTMMLFVLEIKRKIFCPMIHAELAWSWEMFSTTIVQLFKKKNYQEKYFVQWSMLTWPGPERSFNHNRLTILKNILSRKLFYQEKYFVQWSMLSWPGAERRGETMKTKF